MEKENYIGRIPACGVFCGACPIYIRKLKSCPGAEMNRERCERCKTFHTCCKEKNITHCHECTRFPCYKFRNFASQWLKYGQDLIQNQYLLRESGEEGFIKYYNNQYTTNS